MNVFFYIQFIFKSKKERVLAKIKKLKKFKSITHYTDMRHVLKKNLSVI